MWSQRLSTPVRSTRYCIARRRRKWLMSRDLQQRSVHRPGGVEDHDVGGKVDPRIHEIEVARDVPPGWDDADFASTLFDFAAHAIKAFQGRVRRQRRDRVHDGGKAVMSGRIHGAQNSLRRNSSFFRWIVKKP